MKQHELEERRLALLDKINSIQEELKSVPPGSERDLRLNRGVTKILAEIDELNDREAQMRAAKKADIRSGLQSGKYFTETSDRDPLRDPKDQTPVFTGNDPWDTLEEGVLGRHTSVNEAKSRAKSAVELAAGLSEASREKATGILEDEDPDGVISRYALATSDPDYVSAFSQMLRDVTPLLTDPEIRAVRRVKEFARAMSLTDSAGGFLVPFQLDPAVIQTDDLGVSDIRRISKKVIATGDIWNGVSSGAVSWSWDAEAAEVSDDATTFAQPAITIHMARGFVPISIEALQDEANVTQAVSSLLVDGRNDLEGTALATGSGSGQPFGIVTAVTAEATPSATTDVFALADVNAIYDALPARYKERATWLADPAIYNLVRGFGAAGAPAPFITELKDEQLIKRPMAVSSYMDGTITASATNLVLLFGDFSNYVIADRIGMTVELVPHLFATANNRPSGQRGFFAFYRTGADSVNDSAFEILDVT